MSRIAYVNGQYRDMRDASVNIEDRGYQFSDGVYEVCEIRGGKVVDMPRHLTRLQRSLRELRIDMPMPLSALEIVIHETVRRNRVTYGIVYLQVTRGVARRDHAFPLTPVRPAVVITARGLNFQKNQDTAASGSSPFRKTAGPGSISSRCRCCPMCWRNSRPVRTMLTRHGSSMEKVM